jgi:hypothetical protein
MTTVGQIYSVLYTIISVATCIKLGHLVCETQGKALCEVCLCVVVYCTVTYCNYTTTRNYGVHLMCGIPATKQT